MLVSLLSVGLLAAAPAESPRPKCTYGGDYCHSSYVLTTGSDGGILAKFPRRTEPFKEMFSWDYSISGTESQNDTSFQNINTGTGDESSEVRIQSKLDQNIFLLYDTIENKITGIDCIGYDGPGGPCYDGPGGAMYDGPGGPMYDGPGGAMYDGPGGPMYDGPGGAMYDGPGGPMYAGPGGAMYDGPGGPMYSGPGGPMYSGPGGPMYEGPGSSLGSFTNGSGPYDFSKGFYLG